MANDKNESKLVPRLDLNFTDYAIDIFVPSFEFEDEGGKYTKDKIIISFNLKGNLKGLKLRCYRKGGKRFMLSYWLNKKSLTFPCGLFRKNVYGVKEVEELSVNKITELDEEYEKKKESIELPYEFTKSDYIKDIIKDANKSNPIHFNEMKELLEPIFDFINNPYSNESIENHSLRKDDLFEKLESATSNLTNSYFANIMTKKEKIDE